MTDAGRAPEPPPTPSPTPGDRRLARPPSERYRAAEEAAASRAAGPVRQVSVGRGVAYAVIAAIAVGAVVTVSGGVLTITAGLLVLAVFGGWATAWALRAGAGATISAARRATLAAGLAVGGVLLGALGLWLYARTEGGVLPLFDYLGEVFGPVIPIGAALAGVTAWVSAR